MKTMLFVFFIVVLSAGHASSQSNLAFDKQWIIKASPLALLEPETFVVQGGAEYFLSPRWSIQSEIGINPGVVGLPAGRFSHEDFKLWRSKNEIKYHFPKFYLGSEFFFVGKDFLRNNNSYNSGTERIYYDQAKVNFWVYGFGVKIGNKNHLTKNLLLDKFIGLGGRHRYREITPTGNFYSMSPDGYVPGGNVFGGERYSFNGWDKVPHLSLGVKLGYALTKKPH
jgi:hypothetical protein